MNSVLLDTNERRKRVGLRTPEERIVVEERETARRWMSIMGSYQASPTSLIEEDYDQCGNAVQNPTMWNSNFVSTESISTSVYTVWGLNAAGLAGIDKNGWTQIGLRSYLEYYSSGTPPGGDAYHRWRSSENGGTASDPKLIVTFTVPSNYDESVSDSIGAGDVPGVSANFPKSLSDSIGVEDTPVAQVTSPPSGHGKAGAKGLHSPGDGAVGVDGFNA